MKSEYFNEKQKRMIEIMEEISEECYCATWMQGVEMSAYIAMKTGSTDYGQSVISRELIEELEALSMELQSWPFMDVNYDIAFIPIHSLGVQ